MVKAQSAPGTTISSSATTQKVTTDPAAMNGLPSLPADAATLSTNRAKVLPDLSTPGPDRGRISLVDAIDRKILALLQDDGRLTITELATRIGLSVSPC